MLLILKPLSFVFLSIWKCVYAISLPFALYVFAFIIVPIFEYGFAFSIWFSIFNFTTVNCTVFECISANFDFLSVDWTWKKEKAEYREYEVLRHNINLVIHVQI